jgi:hypothetical protein
MAKANRIFTKKEKALIDDLRAINFPKSKQMDSDTKNSNPLLCGISDEQSYKLAMLWTKVYGHQKDGYDSAHHYLLQGIVEHRRMEYIYGESRLSDECLFDVYNIAPELFDVDKLKAYYVDAGVYIKEDVAQVNLIEQGNDSNGRKFTFNYSLNGLELEADFIYIQDQGSIQLCNEENDIFQEYRIDRFEIMDNIESNIMSFEMFKDVN